MEAIVKPVYPVAVRELVEFAWRQGNLGDERQFVGRDRALAGIRGHQRLQRARPTGYQKEVALTCTIDAGPFSLVIKGRIDGLLAAGNEVILEEIKTVQSSLPNQPDPLHWAQVQIYGFIHAQNQGLSQITLQLTYLELDGQKQAQFQQTLLQDDLSAFFHETTTRYLAWITEWHQWRLARDQSLRSFPFPYPRYRPGQRELAVAVYRAIVRSGRLFAEAPTGIGKTVSVLFPALKAMGEGRIDRLFYLTARTPGRTVAEKTIRDLRPAGVRLRALTLTAKEKLCFQPGLPCEPLACPFAAGYYDRHREAIRAALRRENVTRVELEAVAREFQVCPFELGLDLSVWVDLVICDYNYVFDPQAYLRRHFDDTGHHYVFLVDEAHNLPDRARDMFSADLAASEINAVRRAAQKSLPRCARALSKLHAALRKLGGAAIVDDSANPTDPPELDLFPDKPSPQEPRQPNPSPSPGDKPGERQYVAQHNIPEDILALTAIALDETEKWLVKNQPAEFRPQLLELFFRMNTFLRTAGLYDEHYVTLLEYQPTTRLRLFCLDPSHPLREALKRGDSAIFFSATLTPLNYFQTLLGGDEKDPWLRLPSPFPPENLCLLVHDGIQTHLRARAKTLADVTQAILALVMAQPGNYLVYLPSFRYLESVQKQFQELRPDIPVQSQRPGMTEPERDAFLAEFTIAPTGLRVGFAVMGGIFGEGIDLVGDRLIGAIVVGVGLPQICAEREQMRDHFQQRLGQGFAYAYSFPGLNRVLQAAGRVIRSETDRGVVMLIDTRFAEPRYAHHFPPWWQVRRVASPTAIQQAALDFWGNNRIPS